MHTTLSQNFIGYIDNFYYDDNCLRVSGWIVSKHPVRDDVTLFLDIGHSVIFYNFNERVDVANFYNTDSFDYTACGFDIQVPATIRDNYTIYATVGGVREDIVILNPSTNRAYTPETRLANETKEIKLRNNSIPSLIVVDNFYDNPDYVREIALQQSFEPDLRYHKGKRTQTKFIAQGTKEFFESLIGRKITNWVDYEYNGIFQYCTAEDPLVYHVDTQSYAAAVYLTPDAPVETGTTFYRSRTHTDVRKLHLEDYKYKEVFKNGYYDKTQFDQVDTVGNIYNRLTIWDARLIHSATQYFGNTKENSRLFHLFFFDIED